METEILKKAIHLAMEKNTLSRTIAESGRHTLSAVAGALGISKSNLYEQANTTRHTNYSDQELLELIDEILKERPTYGYRRVTACLNRALKKAGRPRVTNYVLMHDIATAEAVLLLLHTWFDDYNENHPHKGLKMMSPREFKLQQTG